MKVANKKNHLTLTIAVLLAIVGLSAGLFVSQHMHAKKKIDITQLHGTLLDQPRSVSPFSLTGTDDKPFNNASLQGSWTMMFFGFTNCGYMCPTAMAELGKTYRLLEEKGVKSLPHVVMVSVDPKRDTLDKLNQYVKAFDSHFYGATGSNDAIKALTHQMGIAYLKVTKDNGEDDTNYDIEHTGTVMLFNPKGELVAFFTTPHKSELLAKDYMLITA